MTWNKWLKEKRFTLFRSSIIQEQFIQCIINNIDGDSILETGFGFATTTELLRDLGYDVEGFDKEPLAVENAIKNFPLLKDRVFVGDLFDESSYKKEYDAIVHQGVLEHFTDNEIKEILELQVSKSKKVIFDVPNNLRKDKSQEGVFTRFETPQHWENLLSELNLNFKRYGRTYDDGDDLLPKILKRYDSELMKTVGRSSIFVVGGKK